MIDDIYQGMKLNIFVRIPIAMRINPLYLVLTLLLTGAACSAISPSSMTETYHRQWSYRDVKTIDPVDSTHPERDIIAVYLRSSGNNEREHMRFDLLDVAIRSETDLYIAVDSAPGGDRRLPIKAQADIDWDTLLIIPASGNILSINPRGDIVTAMGLNVYRDPSLDTIEISFKRDAIPLHNPDYRIQVFTAQAGTNTIEDMTEIISHSDPIPKGTQVLLVFWNTLPAYTPAQAIRRWDGAHTGPLGGRHGLYYLLQAAEKHNTPIALLDLKSIGSLSALDYASGTQYVKNLAQQGLLILPEVVPNTPLPDWAREKAANTSREVALSFGIPPSQFVYTPTDGEIPNRYPVIFSQGGTSGNDQISDSNPTSQIQRIEGRSIIPIPQEIPAQQATAEGLSLESRARLVQNALTGNHTQGLDLNLILILGGDLPNSTWGEPGSAQASLRYLTAHPWIRVLDGMDLLSAHTAETFEKIAQDQPANNSLESLLLGLMKTPKNILGQTAWEAFLALYSPVSPSPEKLSELREHYLGQIGVILMAAHWADHPSSISDCTYDIDYDGRPECILASNEILNIYNIDEGALTYAFTRQGEDIHQFIAPSSQFTIGMSDPAYWDLSRGLSADPGVIPGAFSDELGPYEVLVEEDRIAFKALNSSYHKTYRLTDNGIQVTIKDAENLMSTIPLAVDPWERFSQGWGWEYESTASGDGYSWGISDGIQIEVISSADFRSFEFNDTQNLMGKPENPNYDYPPGHYLPLPLALVEIDLSGDTVIELHILK